MFKIKREARISDFVVDTFPFILRLSFVQSPIILRSFFDSRTERERRLNGGSTEDERRTNEKRTENERRTNGERTENNAENIPSELLGGLQYSFIVNIFSGVNKNRFWDIALSTKKTIKSYSTFVGFQPSIQQNKR